MESILVRLSRLRLRTVIIIILGLVFLLGGSLFYLWRWLGLQIERLIVDQFNQQQLMVARKIADNIEFYLDFLEYQAVTYRFAFKIEGKYPEHFQEFLASEAEFIKDYGIVAIRLYDAQGRLYHKFPAGGPPVATLTPARLTWLRQPENRERFLLTKISPVSQSPTPPERLFSLLAPLNGPAATGSNSELIGILELLVNPFYICQLVTQDVRSGKTGYAWIVDQDGFFLAHYEPEFIGHHHIEVRKRRAPTMAFSRIDEIVSDHLLKGEEGTDWYVSGWHREKVGTIKKLIAYTPINFTKGLIQGRLVVEDAAHNRWGVGVVAPIDEVYGLIGRFQWEQGLLTSFVFVIITGVGLLIIGGVYSWNRILSQEVASKTEALQQSHERLLRSERFAAVGKAAAYVSHEIKNPLMIIGGFAKQLQRQPEIPPNAKEKLQIIVEEVRRLENFLNELRDFTRPAVPCKKEADLNALVREVVNMMQDAAAASGVKINLELDESLPTAVFDPNQIKQVLINLIKNAIEAMESGGQITITTGSDGEQLRLAVSDTGKGIPPEILPQIFNPFFTTKKSGTGLGLAVINKIVEDHQGSISVESREEQGTTFIVVLPCRTSSTHA